METWWKYYLNILCILLLTAILTNCEAPQAYNYYRKQFTATEQKQLASTLLEGIGGYYQGSTAEQMLLFEALGYDSTNAKIVREIGVPYLKRGIATAFPHWYGRAADLDPLGWTGWRGYLYLYFYRDYHRAIYDFDATDILTPNQVDYPQSLSVDYLRGIAYLMIKDYDQAITYLEKHIEYESNLTGFEYLDSKVLLFEGIAFFGKDDIAAALEAFEAGLTIDDENADLLLWTAKAYLQQGQHTVAQTYLEQAQVEFSRRNYNRHGYVEEFYQTYQEDIDDLRREIRASLGMR